MARILTSHLIFCQLKRVIFFVRFATFAIARISNWIATKLLTFQDLHLDVAVKNGLESKIS